MKKITILILLTFLLFSCATTQTTSKHASPTSSDMVSDAAVNTGVNLATHVGADPIDLIWGGLGLIGKAFSFFSGSDSKVSQTQKVSGIMEKK